MSGNSYDSVCTECESEMYSYSDHKPYEYTVHECLECGWYTTTMEGRYTLEEVNELRYEIDEDSKPLKELKKIDFVERKTQERKILDKVKDWLDNNIEADITVDLIEDNKQLLKFIKEQELSETNL